MASKSSTFLISRADFLAAYLLNSVLQKDCFSPERDLFDRFTVMLVTELARLSLQPDTESIVSRIAGEPREAKEVMQQASGFEFWYYQCVEDPNVIFILGSWPSVDFHMREFIPSQPNQELLASLKDQVTVEWMFHLNIDPKCNFTATESWCGRNCPTFYRRREEGGVPVNIRGQ